MFVIFSLDRIMNSSKYKMFPWIEVEAAESSVYVPEPWEVDPHEDPEAVEIIEVDVEAEDEEAVHVPEDIFSHYELID